MRGGIRRVAIAKILLICVLLIGSMRVVIRPFSGKRFYGIIKSFAAPRCARTGAEQSKSTTGCLTVKFAISDKNGYDAAKSICALNRPDAKATPIYAMTANAFSEDVAAALNAGMNGHSAKPIEKKLLYMTLDIAFKQNHGTQERSPAL